jgi:hypothetical protein
MERERGEGDIATIHAQRVARDCRASDSVTSTEPYTTDDQSTARSMKTDSLGTIMLNVICDCDAVILRYGTFVRERGPFSTANLGLGWRMRESTTETLVISLLMVYTWRTDNIFL